MKHLMTLIALVVAVTAGAQVTYPWNPDSNADEFIGFTDILDLLAVYGSEFSPENIICNTDSSSAMVYLGDKNFVNCSNSCDSLGSIWHLPKTGEIISQHPNLIPIDTEAANVVWMNLKERKDASGDIYGFPPYAIIQPNGYLTFAQNSTSFPYAHINELRQCYCATQERPKVEYTFCSSTISGDFQLCCNTKTEDGWYPLPNPVDFGSQAHLYSQAFWRWAE